MRCKEKVCQYRLEGSGLCVFYLHLLTVSWPVRLRETHGLKSVGLKVFRGFRI